MPSYHKKRFSVVKIADDEIVYTNIELLSKFIAEGGRIIPSRISNVSSSQQRKISQAIKHARYLALLPYCATHA